MERFGPLGSSGMTPCGGLGDVGDPLDGMPDGCNGILKMIPADREPTSGAPAMRPPRHGFQTSLGPTPGKGRILLPGTARAMSGAPLVFPCLSAAIADTARATAPDTKTPERRT